MKQPIEILHKELEALKDDLIRRYEELGMKASGAWEQSLQVQTDEVAGLLKGTISGEGYTYYMQHGRKAGNLPPIAAIEQWIRARGIQPIEKKMKVSGLAWAIAKKIAREGTKRSRNEDKPAFIDEVITGERVQEIINKVGDGYIGAFTSEIINFLKRF